jgi:parallel beta-helix repeat protein
MQKRTTPSDELADFGKMVTQKMTEPEAPSKGIKIFFSYSHKDEELRDELEKHLSILKHRKLISAWHDRKIGAGEEWKGEIDEHLNSAKIVLLLISSDFLASKYCYDIEMKRAMEMHDAREARVIPIILRHAYWEGSPFSNLQALPANAEPIKDGNWRSIDAAFKNVAEGLELVINDIKQENNYSELNLTICNNVQKILVVDQMHNGDFTTINEAISAAAPGSRILVRSGVYDEGLIIDKPLVIVGDGRLSDVIIRSAGKSAILFKAIRGKVSNLLIRQNGGGNWYGVDITQGCLELECCDIASDSKACVAVHGNACPRIIGNKIHDGKIIGVYIYENGEGVIKDNDIYDNEGPCIMISSGGNPAIMHNNIYNGKCCGICVNNNGRSIIEDNDIYRNASSGIEISSGGNPKVINNKIHDGIESGISVHNCKGIIECNDIYCNASSGIEILDGGNPKIINNKIHDGKSWGIYILRSQGFIEDNDIFGNINSNICISGGGNPKIIRNKIHDGKSWGIFVSGGQAVIEDNDIYKMGSLSIHISDNGSTTIKHNQIK